MDDWEWIILANLSLMGYHDIYSMRNEFVFFINAKTQRRRATTLEKAKNMELTDATLCALCPLSVKSLRLCI